MTPRGIAVVPSDWFGDVGFMTGRQVQLQSKGKRHPSITGEVALG